MKKLILAIIFLLFGCSEKTESNTYEWVLVEDVSWSAESKTCLEQGLKLPTKNDFLAKIEQNPKFFDKNTLYKVNPTIDDKIVDNKQLGSYQIFNHNNDNIYFNAELKKLQNYAVKLQDGDNIKIKMYCIKNKI